MRTFIKPHVFLKILSLLYIMLFISCKKDWLDKKPDQSLVVPTGLSDLQGLLDNNINMNLNQPALGEVGADNHYIRQSILQTQTDLTINSYIWAANGFPGNPSLQDWNFPYTAIFYTNEVLYKLESIDKTSLNADSWNNVYGSSLFFRAYSYFNLIQLFAKAYDPITSASDPGIPLRLQADVTQKVGRGNVKQVYDQILKDLIEAKDYLPYSALYKTRPNKPGVFGLLARVYLSMSDYQKALQYSDSCLNLNNTLLNYSVAIPNPSIAVPFPQFHLNPEIIFYAKTIGPANLAQTRASIDSVLYNSYDNNDLRKTVFFTTVGGRIVWKGNYTGANNSYFTGIATDEIYFIRAESYARLGDKSKALADLNMVMSKRWKNNGTWTDITASTVNEALIKILTERRKELAYRALRWTDLRRLNKESQFAKTIVRIYNGQTYMLAPLDNKYVWPIPDNEIIYAGLEQNPR